MIQAFASHPDVIAMVEQWTRVEYTDVDGKDRHTLVDLHILLRCGREFLVSTKYDAKARRPSYLDEVRHIAEQVPTTVADGFVVASRRKFHPNYLTCAEVLHLARRGWDPEGDLCVEAVAQSLGDKFLFGELIERTGLAARGYRAAVRLFGDGVLRKDPIDLFEPSTVCWRDV